MAKKTSEQFESCSCGQVFDDKHWQYDGQCPKCSGKGYRCPRCETEMGLPSMPFKCPACRAGCLLEKL